MLEVRFREQMEGSIERLQLQGKIIFVAGDTRKLAAFAGGHKHGSGPQVQVLIGIGNRASNFLYRNVRAVGRQIGTEKSTRAVDRVAVRAARLSEEKRLASLRITRNRSNLASSLKNPQVGHHGLELRHAQRSKRGHSRRRYSRLQDAQSVLVGQLLNFGACGDIGPALAASPVQAVAGSTNRFEHSAAIRRGRTAKPIFSRGRISPLRSGRNQQCASSKEYCNNRCREKAVRRMQDESCLLASPGLRTDGEHLACGGRYWLCRAPCEVSALENSIGIIKKSRSQWNAVISH